MSLIALSACFRNSGLLICSTYVSQNVHISSVLSECNTASSTFCSIPSVKLRSWLHVWNPLMDTYMIAIRRNGFIISHNYRTNLNLCNSPLASSTQFYHHYGFKEYQNNRKTPYSRYQQTRSSSKHQIIPNSRFLDQRHSKDYAEGTVRTVLSEIILLAVPWHRSGHYNAVFRRNVSQWSVRAFCAAPCGTMDYLVVRSRRVHVGIMGHCSRMWTPCFQPQSIAE